MSLKSIELQVAVPRTQDAGKIQEQHQQRSQIDQFQAQSAQKKDAELKRISVDKQDRTDRQKFLNDQQNPNSKHHQKEKQRSKQDDRDTKHPYKGHHVDFSG